MPDKPHDLFPVAERNNDVTVRIGGYQTTVPLSDATD